MAVTIEQILEKASTVLSARDRNRIEVSEAKAAAETALRETDEADAAVIEEVEALDRLKTLVIDYTPSSPAEDLDAILAASQVVFQSRGKRVIELDEAVAAVNAAIDEQSQADAATADYDAAIGELKIAAGEYTPEE